MDVSNGYSRARSGITRHLTNRVKVFQGPVGLLVGAAETNLGTSGEPVSGRKQLKHESEAPIGSRETFLFDEYEISCLDGVLTELTTLAVDASVA